MNIPLKELSREEAKEALDRVAESRGITVSVGQVIKHLSLSLLLPTSLVIAAAKKILYRSGVETEDSIILDFLLEIPKAFRPSLYYDLWLIIPKTEAGEANIKQVIKEIVGKTGVPPLTNEEWEDAKPIIEKLKGQLKVKGVEENLWKTL
ncbi:MAG: hypothetical protein N3E36_01830 [Sulfolobales archaeon]|nr:hypothetical protein [Sulfolobales archaeon]MCX8198754.1 hypothetical protein [Sulfolobales archaeon]MDW8169827.1 hypothetical protein [Desulfurococcaceae archaeon]